MTSGDIHNKMTVAITPVVIIGVSLLVKNPWYGIVAGAGCLSGMVLTPDLDQEGINKIEWIIIKKSLGLGFLWLMYWYPYALIMKHRSFASHFPIVSTAIRFIYQFWALFIFSDIDIVYYALFFVGLCFSDIVHYYLD